MSGSSPRPLLLAVDVGATNTRWAVLPADIARDPRALAGAARAEPTTRDPAALVAWLAEVAGGTARDLGGRLVAGALAAPGPLDPGTGRVLRSPNLGWVDVPVAAMLADAVGVPVALEDDAKTAALGEWQAGAGHGDDPFAYLTVSSGVGAGLVVGGRIVRGAGGNAGEVGHLRVSPDGPRCGCGRRGDVEAYLGGRALARRARATWPSRGAARRHGLPRDAAAVFAAAHAGDARARMIVAEARAALSVALAALAAVVDPATIAVGGAVALGQPAMVRSAAAMARRSILVETGRSVRIVPARLGHGSVLAGGMMLAARLVEQGAADRVLGGVGPGGSARRRP